MQGAQIADFEAWSEDLSSLNPVSVGRLTDALRENKTVSLFVNVKFTRPKPDNVCGPPKDFEYLKFNGMELSFCAFISFVVALRFSICNTTD